MNSEKISAGTSAVTTEYVFPVAVVCAEKTENAEAITKEKELQINLVEPQLTRIEKGGFLVLDFGRELAGGVRILAFDAGCRVRLRLGESVSETFSELAGSKPGCNDHAVRDAEVFLPSLCDQKFFQSGFRFLRIDAPEKDVAIKSVAAVYKHVGYDRVGVFNCADEVVNRIFDTAAHTVTLCMQNGMLWDGVKRDRLVWIGDMYPEFLAGFGLYKECDYARRCLDYARETTPLPGWMNTMPTYSLWWILCLKEYVFHTGDIDFLRKNRYYLDELLKIYDGCISDDGEINTPGIFLDWPSHDTPDEKFGVRAIAKMAADAADVLTASLFYKNPHTESIKRKLASVKGAPAEKKQAVALSLLAGYDADPALLIKDGACGMSTFMSWAILNAAHDYASPEAAAKMCRDYYGAMLKLGATSFWEDFDMSWLEGAAPVTRLSAAGEKDVHGDYGKYCYKGFRHSLCHGWSAGVINYLQTRVLGVRPVQFGGLSVRVRPCPEYGDMTGVVPVAGGLVKVEVKSDRVGVEASPGIEIIAD